jgi:hypothetical protein
MHVHFRDNHVLVTDEVFATRWPDPQRFYVAELEDLHVVQGAVDPLVNSAIHIAATIASVALAAAALLRSVEFWLIAISIVAVAGAVAGSCWRLCSRPLELRATYRGYRVLLFSSPDERTFGQVRRALMRAVEGQESFRLG